MSDFTRVDWHAAPPKAARPKLVNVPYGIVHHIGGGPMWPTNVADVLRGIQRNEQAGEYTDFSYNWAVDLNGDNWEGRGDVADGATLGYSGRSFSVLVVCNAAVPGFVMPAKVTAGIIRCFQNAAKRGVLAGDAVGALEHAAFIEGHHWFDMHVTKYPTACPSAVESSVPAIQVGFHSPNPVPAKPPVIFSKGENLLFVDHVHSTEANRSRSMEVLPDGNIVLNNDCHVEGTGKGVPSSSLGQNVLYLDVQKTYAPGESFVGAERSPQDPNYITYQTRLSTGKCADKNIKFVN